MKRPGFAAALASFVGPSPFVSLSKARETAEDTLKGTLIGLLGGSTYSHDGRKIHSSRPDEVRPDEVRPDGIAANVWQRMMTHYEFRIQLVAVGQIEPGLHVLANERWALLCGPLGPNLRNRVAHGLVSAPDAEGHHGLYLWWFALKLVFIQYYKRLHDSASASSPDDAGESTP